MIKTNTKYSVPVFLAGLLATAIAFLFIAPAAYAEPPASVEVDVYQNENLIGTYEILASEDWYTAIPDLPKYDDSEALYRYEVRERPVTGYSAEIYKQIETEAGHSFFFVRNEEIVANPDRMAETDDSEDDESSPDDKKHRTQNPDENDEHQPVDRQTHEQQDDRQKPDDHTTGAILSDAENDEPLSEDEPVEPGNLPQTGDFGPAKERWVALALCIGIIPIGAVVAGSPIKRGD